MTKKWVYLFAEGNATMRNLLGGKGAGVAEMTRAGLPVPPGFTITTEACNAYYENNRQFPEGMWDQVLAALKEVERQTGKKFGDPANPLLVSVRSGARESMPGMMDTVLNLGLNEQTLHGIIEATGNERFAYDSFRRFIQMFSKIVLDIDPDKFDQILEDEKEKKGARLDTDLDAADMKRVAERFQALVQKETGKPFPSDPLEQLRLAIQAVFRSWNNERAITYRNYYKIPHDLGTAVNVQTMAFGNMGNDSGTGVAFTRNPSTGERQLFGEYLLNAQGEDVVAGIRTPQPIAHLREELPEVYAQFQKIADQMERHYKDMQDLEFTVERGRLYMLQTRSGKRSAAAAVKIAVDMVEEGLISKEDAVRRVEPTHVEALLHRQIDPAAKVRVIARGLNASPGAAVGKAVFDSERAEEWAKNGERVILVRQETNPDDVKGMIVAQGVLTARGGATSHAAVVARQIGKPCVAGTETLKVDVDARQFSVDGVVVKEGDEIAINGTTGEVILGAVPLIEPTMSNDLKKLLGWADDVRKLMVWANADYPRDAAKAREYGAQGIGLCRTEHMFFEQERLPIVRRMILAEEEAERQKALDELLPIQREDFKGIFRAMDGCPVVIRLIDPPLHEFLPHYDDLLVEVTEERIKGSVDPEKEHLLRKVAEMREQNPMLGLRGCRLGILVPGIVRMQVRAILEAAHDVKKEGVDVHPEIMIPLVGHVNELRVTRDELEAEAKKVEAERGPLSYKFGTMIEIPRAALTAGEIAEYAEFFSFGTNDLTQTTFGISRDDAEGKFLLQYVERKILPVNPFQALDRNGVGRLMRIAVEDGRKTRPDLEVGICGEHGGEPSSVEFCHQLGLNYVSCSPFRVPIARLAAAQAALAPAVRDR
ncbi:MAG TPA: pyruvate, phosphate dikinase [Chloroflexota bacterium]|nr:pyruvate, phosphate dikinase [Chloroflexota bacterium]